MALCGPEESSADEEDGQDDHETVEQQEQQEEQEEQQEQHEQQAQQAQQAQQEGEEQNEEQAADEEGEEEQEQEGGVSAGAVELLLSTLQEQLAPFSATAEADSAKAALDGSVDPEEVFIRIRIPRL